MLNVKQISLLEDAVLFLVADLSLILEDESLIIKGEPVQY